MADKDTKDGDTEATELKDEQLDKVQGAGPFDASLSNVRIHTGSKASTDGQGAAAFTKGSDITLKSTTTGQTESESGLVAHELTHVLGENGNNEEGSEDNS